MLYSTNNVVISLTLQMGDLFRENGYDLFWRTTGNKVNREDTALESKGIVTMTSYFPANPTYFVRLKNRTADTTEQHQVIVPAFTLYTLQSPVKEKREGIGSSVFFRERPIRIMGFVEDQFQHREFIDLLHTWLDRENTRRDKRLKIWNYDEKSNNPDELPEVNIPWAKIFGQEVYGDSGVTRYYIEGTFVIHYVE